MPVYWQQLKLSGGKKEKLLYTDVFSATESQIQKKKLQGGFELNHAKLN